MNARGMRGLARRGRFVGTVALAVLLWASAAAAQTGASGAAREPGVEPLGFTLASALDYATGSNPSVRQAVNATRLNGVQMRTTWLSQLMPSAQLTLFRTSFNGNLTRQGVDDFGNPVANPGADWNYFSQTIHNLAFDWRIQGPSLFQTHRQQSLVNLDREVAERRAVTELQVRVQRRYMDALEQQELLRAEEELVEARRIDLDVAERLFSLALKTRVDVLNAELEIEQQALALRRQQAAWERALLSLRTEMGLSDDGPLELADEALPIFDPSLVDADAMVSRAFESNPAIIQSGVATRTAELGLASQKTAWWPEVTLGVDIYRRSFQPRTGALFDPSVGSNIESQFSLGFSLPILNDFFRADADRQEASIALSNQREADRQARLELEEAVRGAVLDLGNEWESLRLSERSSVIAAEALELARQEYRLGTRSFEDLRSSFQLEADTRRQVITARHAFYDALLALEEAVGAPVREFVPSNGPAGG